MNPGSQKTSLERRILHDRRVYDYLNSSGLDIGERSRYDRRKKRRRKILSFKQRKTSL